MDGVRGHRLSGLARRHGCVTLSRVVGCSGGGRSCPSACSDRRPGLGLEPARHLRKARVRASACPHRSEASRRQTRSTKAEGDLACGRANGEPPTRMCVRVGQGCCQRAGEDRLGRTTLVPWRGMRCVGASHAVSRGAYEVTRAGEARLGRIVARALTSGNFATRPALRPANLCFWLLRSCCM